MVRTLDALNGNSMVDRQKDIWVSSYDGLGWKGFFEEKVKMDPIFLKNPFWGSHRIFYKI